MYLSPIVSNCRVSPELRGQRTFHAFGANTSTSSSEYIACEYIPCEKYMSANSAQDSASMGQKSSKAVKPATASEMRPKDRRSVIRRFVMGYGCQYLFPCSWMADAAQLTILVLFSANMSSYSFRTFSRAASSAASASFSNPLKAIIRSLLSPKRLTSLSRHSCAAFSSPVRRHDSSRFS